MNTKFSLLKIVLPTLVLTLSLSGCLSGEIEPSPEVVGYRTVSLHITQAPTTRVMLYEGEMRSLCDEEYDVATRGAVTEQSRSVSRPIPDGEFLHFRRGDLYLVTAQGVIVRHYRLIRDTEDITPGIPYINVDDFFNSFRDNDQERVRRLYIENVPGQVTKIVIIGNTPHNTQGNIDHIGRQLLDVRSQYDAWGVNLFGKTAGLNLNQNTGKREGSMYLRPNVARIEIASVTGVGAIIDFTLAGIFIDNVFHHTAINGEIDRNSLRSGGTNPDAFRSGQGLFTNTANFRYALFDWNPNGLGVPDANNPLRLTPPQVPNYLINNNYVDGRWAYQVFAPHDAAALSAAYQPRIVLRLHNVRLRDGTAYATRFVTLNEFADFADIQASRVFRLNVVFDERDLRAEPNAVSYLTATHPGLMFTRAGGRHLTPVTVSTNVREGWVISDFPSWLSEGSFSVMRGAQGTATFYVEAGTYAAGAPRTGVITVSSPCGRTRDYVSITQIGVGVETAIRDRFVGAFWRDEQVGERLIRMNMNISPGTGAANNAPPGTPILTIAANAGWVAMATVPWIQLCNNPDVFNFATDFPEETGHQIIRDDTPHLPAVTATEGLRIEGTGNQINFRIGLRSINPNPVVPDTWEPRWRQPRYGQVIITYNITADPATTRVHILWIRQGEGSDFLMRPEDDFDGQERSTVARRFSPFNLTATNLNYTGTANNTRNFQLPVRTPADNPTSGGGIFTRYPTQTGAFFQWAGSGTGTAAGRARLAMSPIGIAGLVGANAGMLHGLWGGTGTGNNLGATHETCPPGWRRFNDGSISVIVTAANNNSVAAIRASEMRMSLFLEPRLGGNTTSTANTAFGYYADGFFDRRTPGARQTMPTTPTAAVPTAAQNNLAARSTVSNNNRYVAHRGMLLFNPYSSASLFFPAAGRRNNGGHLVYVGNEIIYWTSTSSQGNVGGTSRAWVIRGGLDSNNATNNIRAHNDPNRADAKPIRCVRM